MASVNIIRHKPIPIFCSTAEVVITYDDNQVVRLIEPSGNVGTQYSQELGSQWFGTIQNLNPGLARGGANWGDIYKTDVLWTTPSTDRDVCEAYRNDFNAVYGPLIQSVTGCELKSNRMARFTHAEGFPDPAARFEVQIKAIKGEDISFGNGKIEFGDWTDIQPSGASVQHTDANGNLVTTLGDDVKQEMEFVLVEQYEKKLAADGVDFKTQTAWLEVLVAIDDNPAVTWQRIETVKKVIADYFGDNLPAGKIYPVSRIPNLDGIVEPQPRCVAGDVTIDRSGDIVDGFSTWTAIRRQGVSEVLVSGVGGDNGDTILNTIDGHIKSAGGQGLKENGVFNNAYIVAGANTEESRARLTTFNEQFSGYYTGVAPSGRTAQYVPGFMQERYICGISNRAIYAG
ncbi:MAG: hypothetical protein HOH77_16405 [Candidatus Latescibacteria bacterium]|nr:hypothetical protein [Candidatus Latescibacterota bacterium]